MDSTEQSNGPDFRCCFWFVLLCDNDRLEDSVQWIPFRRTFLWLNKREWKILLPIVCVSSGHPHRWTRSFYFMPLYNEEIISKNVTIRICFFSHTGKEFPYLFTRYYINNNDYYQDDCSNPCCPCSLRISGLRFCSCRHFCWYVHLHDGVLELYRSVNVALRLRTFKCTS